MLNDLLKDEVQNFISENEKGDVYALSLKKSPFSNIPMRDIIQQIQGRQVAKQKLPSWYKTKYILYPPKVNLEQTSSEETANFKASLVNGESLCDVTGGFGVDSFAFSHTFNQVTHIEQNKALQQIAEHNFNALGVNNITSYNDNGIEFLQQNNLFYDVLFVDPSRRGAQNKKVFKLQDCEPNLVEYVDDWTPKCHLLMAKLSPLLDIQHTLKQLPTAKEVYCVAVKNELKELIILIDKTLKNWEKVPIHCVNLLSNEPNYNFTLENEQKANVKYSQPLDYIYLPNVSVLKGGAFKKLSEDFNLYKLDPNTHLYTSQFLEKKFPGEIFKNLGNFSKENINLNNKSFRIINRNYPLTTKQLEKKYKIKSDGISPILFCKSGNENVKLILRNCKF